MTASFDPAQFGATPLAPTPPGFNPTQYGATPVTPQAALASSTSLAQSIWSGIAGAGSAIANTAKAGVQNVESGITGLETPPAVDPNAVKEADAGGGLPAGAADAAAQVAKAGVGGVASLGKTVGGVAQIILSPLLAAINAVGTPIGDAIGKLIPDSVAEKLNDFLKNNPAVGQNASEDLNIANLAIPEVADAAAPAIDAAGNAISDAASGVKDAIAGTPEENAAAAQAALEKTAIQDATPSYNKNLIGEPAINGVPRVQEAGGLTKTRIVTPTQSEIAAGKELATVPNYPVKGTALEKFNSIEPAIAKEGQALQTSLKNENVLRPPAEISKVVRDAVQSKAQDSLLLQKSDPIVKNYLRVANRAIEQSDGTLDGELKVRQALDNAYEDAGGKYGNNKALDQIHRSARNALNDDIEEHAQNTQLKASLKRQSNLYKASDVLQDKAKAEGGSKLDQLRKANPFTTKVVESTAGLAGLGGLLKLLP